MRPFLALILALLIPACARTDTAPSAAPDPTVADSSAIPYDFDAPDAAFYLPRALREISGLTVLPDGALGAIEDEHGELYVLDPDSATVIEQHRFHGRGDYEGLAAVGEAVWVLQSDGDLFEVTDARSDAPHAERHRTGLHRSCDAEGLEYDPAEERLLIVCKEDAGPELPGIRAIYAFHLSSLDRSPNPVFRLDRAVLDAPSRPFKPSALARHPRTGQFYVLSAVRHALAVLNPDGSLAAALALPAARYPQPEGLAFSPDGTLFLSSEGRTGPATLFRFREHARP